MRRGTVRRPGKKGAGGTLKKQMIVMAAMLAILAFEAVYLAYQSSNRLASSVSDVWQLPFVKHIMMIMAQSGQ